MSFASPLTGAVNSQAFMTSLNRFERVCLKGLDFSYLMVIGISIGVPVSFHLSSIHSLHEHIDSPKAPTAGTKLLQHS